MARKIKIDLTAIPTPVRYVIAIGIPVLLIVLFYFFFYRPKSLEMDVLRRAIAKQEQEISDAEAKLRKLPELKALYALRIKELRELKRQLPEEKEVSSLLKQVSDLGIKAGLIIRLWKPSGRKLHSSGVVYEIPVKVAMSGAYHRLGYFFSALSGLNRIVNVSDIKLSNAVPAGNEATLNISFNAITFSAVPENEAASAKKKTSGRGRRRK
ncbi:MAG TPA: hypothetical protein ENH07_08980 [Nitrospirae bacterium]|nr:hypothetical protein [Nitrospirota bacterium]HDY71757.1 hypothetical protein [Nitrospirota bacterium]